MTLLKNHELLPELPFRHIRYENRPVRGRDGAAVAGLHQVWISLDNPAQLNSYTTEAVKEVILAFRRASADRAAVAVVLTGTGERSFCTGGNTAEYATYYAGRPHEYLQYMRLFNDMVTAILYCDKPVVSRVNGLRIAGGQEIGMACDFTVAAGHASFGQAGPVHGSAPDGGSTDFLHLYVGYARAAESLVLCQPWSAYKALRLGLVNEVAAAHRTPEGDLVPDPRVVTDRWLDPDGRIVYGEAKCGAALESGRQAAAACAVDLAPLDEAVERLVTQLLYTFPDCTRKTLESLRKKKLEHWLANSESNRSWLALNMATEAQAGFPAFHFGDRGAREIDFVTLRRRLAEGARWDGELLRAVLPESARRRMEAERRLPVPEGVA
ncbi:MAG TPA: 6-oxocyclohex-1-ene-1-carbonyl-CoA hydratase [Thermoanaerobaculia bacterium]|nr:6-oxocyclohex-1-ene-1-carbonyl-CoA hydratase [Thermoanaerobaculia bacterium]